MSLSGGQPSLLRSVGAVIELYYIPIILAAVQPYIPIIYIYLLWVFCMRHSPKKKTNMSILECIHWLIYESSRLYLLLPVDNSIFSATKLPR